MKVIALAILWVSSFGQGLPPTLLSSLLLALGGMLVLGLFRYLLKHRGVPNEVKLYFAFLLWAILGAAIAAEDLGLSLRSAWKIFQVGMLLWAVVEAHRWHSDLRVVMVGIWGCALTSALLVYIRPETIAGVQMEGQRLSVTGMNPNFTAQIFLFAIFAALYLGQRVSSWRARVVVLGSIPLFGLLLMYTSSRKMLVAIILLVTAWLLNSSWVGMTRGKRLLAHVAIVLTVSGTATLLVRHWEGSLMASRWAKLGVTEDSRFNSRDVLYQQGWQVFLDNPVFGIGLDNQVIKIGSAIHSDYMDVLVSTGILGFILYFSIYLVAFRRARWVSSGGQGVLKLDWRAFRTYLFLLGWLMLGFQRFDDFFNILVIGSFSGRFLAAEMNRKTRNLALSQLSGQRVLPRLKQEPFGGGRR